MQDRYIARIGSQKNDFTKLKAKYTILTEHRDDQVHAREVIRILFELLSVKYLMLFSLSMCFAAERPIFINNEPEPQAGSIKTPSLIQPA